MKSLESVQRQLANDPHLRALVDQILKRCDTRGQLPSQLTIKHCDEHDYEIAARLLSPAAVKFHPKRARLVLNLKRADQLIREEGDTTLLQILCAAADRQVRNLVQEREELVHAATACIARLADQSSGIAREFLLACEKQVAAGAGPYYKLLQDTDITIFETELRLIATAVHAAANNSEPIRLANFARKVTGSTKGFRPGMFRYSMVTEALLHHVPGLRELVDAESPPDRPAFRRVTLEQLNIFRNQTSVDVLCFGDFVLERDGSVYDAAARYHATGEPVKLLLPHLRGARVTNSKADRIVLIENETTFNDYVDWIRSQRRQETVVCTGGQANWAVIKLVQLLWQAAPDIPILHWGDLDRAGVLILRSLIDRTDLQIEPLWMDCAIYQAHLKEGLPVSVGERENIKKLLRVSGEHACNDLLEAILSTGLWIEQESVAQTVLQD